MSADVLKRSMVSVIVPVYNVEKYMEECVDSILAQSYSNIEIILVDDGSTDHSGEICDRYATKYPEKVRVIHKSNGGLSSARNTGLDVAKGEFIGFIDSDDIVLPEMYNEMLEAMERYDVDIVASHFLPWELGHKMSSSKRLTFTGNSYEALTMCFDWKFDKSAVTKLYRRTAIGELRFHIGLTNEDFPFISELYLKSVPIHVMDKGYYLYRDNDNSITTVFKRSFFDIFENVDYVDALIPLNDKLLRDSFDRYRLQMHIMSAMRIVLSRKNSEFNDWLRINRKYIRKNWKQVFLDPKMNFRWKVKAIVGFMRSPITIKVV